MPLLINKFKINAFLKWLAKKYVVFDLRGEILPVKKFFLPAKEDIFVYDKKSGRLNSSRQEKEFVVFGLKYADLEAMNQLDEIMAKPVPDFFYQQKRAKSILIGLTEHSFEAAPAGDIIFKKINPRQYQVLLLSDKGKKIAKNNFFKEVVNPVIKNYKRKPKLLRDMLLDPELLKDAVVWSQNNPIWDELESICLGCGICTYVCPLCYCFSIEDRISLEDNKRSRCRYWDTCTLSGFSKIAGGHSFRPTLKKRYYNWYFHKFVRGYNEYGRSQCVACGRCRKYCPARIDIEEVLSRIVKEYKRAAGEKQSK